MKTKTQFITKLLAVFAVISFTVGAMLFVINPNLGVANSVNAADATNSLDLTTSKKDGGFTGNMFNIYDGTSGWPNSAGANKVLTSTTGYSVENGYTLDVTITNDMSDDTANNLVWWNKGGININYWVAGKTYIVSYDYKITKAEDSKGRLDLAIQVDGNITSGNTTIEEGEDGWATKTFKFTVASDYVYESGDTNAVRFGFSDFKKDDIINIKNIKVEQESDSVVNGIEVFSNGKVYDKSTSTPMASFEEKTAENGDKYYSVVGNDAGTNNLFLGTQNVAWCAGRTYELSFYVKTPNLETNPNWYLFSRAFVDGASNELDCGRIGTYYTSVRISGKIGDWTKYTYRYTPTANATYNRTDNYFGFVVNIPNGYEIQLKDFTVTMSTDGLKDDIVSNERIVNGRGTNDAVITVCHSTDENAYEDSVYGKVNTITWSNSIDGNRSVWNDKVEEWIDGATYTVYFKVKTSATFTANVQVCVNIAGYKEEYICSEAEVISGSAQTEWKTICKSFTITDLNKGTADSSQTKNIFRFLLTGGAGYEKEEDKQVLYYTDVKVYANVSTVTVNDGTNTTKENFVSGTEKTVTLPEVEIAAGKNHIGWDINGTFYQKDGLQSVTVDSDTTIKAVIIDFATDAGAYLRVVDSADDTGIRFTATADKAAIEEALKNYGTVTEYGMHITAEGISGYLDIVTEKWKEGEKGFASSIVGFNENTKDFYTVKFTAKAYLKLKLNDGETIIPIYAEGTAADKSIVGMAEAALANESQELSETQRKVLQDFASVTEENS